MAGTAITRNGPTLLVSGALTREAVPALWAAAQPLLDGVTHLDLSAAGPIDSAGLAVLVELASNMDATAIHGAPPGLGELRAAYRLTPALRFG